MFKTKLIVALSFVALMSNNSIALAQSGTALDGAAVQGETNNAALEAASAAFFGGDYALANKHCASFARPKKGKTSVQTPDDMESSADNAQMAKDARLSINLGLCHLGMKDPARAQPWFEHAQKLLYKIKEPSTIDIADCLTGLGECHYMQGQSKQSLREYSEAIGFYKQKFGRWHPDSIPALEGLAGSHYMEGDYEAALPLYEQVARIDLVQFGPVHPRLGFSFNNVAEVFYKMNGCTSSRAHFEQAIWIFKKNSTDRLLAKLNAESKDIDDTKLATMRKRIFDSIMGTKERPDIESVSYELLKAENFDPKNQTFKLRLNNFENWRIPRRSVEDTLFASIDPKVEQKALIFCLHGLGLHSRSFKDFAEKINSCGYGVIAVDVRGFGSFAMEKGLDKLDLNAGLEDLAAALSLLRSQNPTLPIAVLGESMGGALALQLAAKYPEHVSALVSAVPSGKRYKSASTGLLVGLKLLEDKKKPIEIGKKVIEQSSSDEAVRDVWLNDPNARLTLSAEELVRFQEFMNQTEKLAKDIKETPVIIFQGFKDHLVKPEGTIALYGALATREKDLVLVGDAEHLIFEEGQTPDDIVRMLAAWLDSHIVTNANIDRKSTAVKKLPI